LTVVALERDHLDAVITCLRNAKLVVGNGAAPTNVAPPYVVVHWMEATRFDGPSTNPDIDATFSFQLTCVAADQSEARWLRDTATGALVTGPVPVPNRRPLRLGTGIMPVPGGSTPRRDDTYTPSLFYVTPRFTLSTTPA